MNRIALYLLLTSITFHGTLAVDSKAVLSDKNEKMLQLENKFFQIKLLPGAGGRIMSLLFKPVNEQLVDSDNGCLSDNVWNVSSSRFFLRGKNYQTREKKSPESAMIEMKANASGGGIDFLEVCKKIKITDDSAAIGIDYTFRNMPQAMAALDYGFWFHNVIGVVGKNTTYYYPTDKGIVVVSPENRVSHDRWFYRPARGWCAAAVPNGAGIAMVMDYSRLKCFYSWYGKNTTVPSLEWRFEKMTLKENESFSTQIQMIPFFGLPTVSGAGRNIVGSLEVVADEMEPGEKAEFQIALYSAVKQQVQLDIRLKNGSKGKWKSIAKKDMVFKAPATLAKTSMTYTVEKEGAYSIEVIIRKGKRELARLNNWMVCGDLDGVKSLEHLKKRTLSTEKKVDLTKCDFSKETPHVKWAKPYCRGKIKLLALTGYQNMREVVELAQRLSLKASVSYLCVNHRPIYFVGDDYGRTTQSDIFDNLEKQLKGEYDVILIGGVPWNYFPKKARIRITEMVKSGTGLVYLDPTTKKGDLNGLTPLINASRTFQGVPIAIKKSFLTNGVPFALFPKSNCRKFKCDGEILAEVNGHPYLATKKFGKGKSVALAYKALGGRGDTAPGLTPEFDNTEQLTGDYWEYYFSLLAKSVIFAADRLPPIRIESMKSYASNGKLSISLKLSSENSCTVSITTTNLNRYSTLLKKMTVDKDLKKGTNDLVLTMPSTPFAGTQTVNIFIKNKKREIINWGTIGVNVEPHAKLAGIHLDKKFYKYGAIAKATIKPTGGIGANLKISCELRDSNSRALFNMTLPAENAEFNIPLNNNLLSRYYTLKATLLDNGKNVDSLEESFIVTPSERQLTWDDYEPGVWVTSNTGLGMRKYLLPQLAEKLHQLGMRTIIANSSLLDRNFAIRYNFNPTALMGIGLSRCEEPKEYVRTGDKFKLVRKPCLSDPGFISQRRHAFSSLSKKLKKYALRFYWLGDEQSITGYGGKPIDFCFSDHCLSKFRKQLKAKYHNIETLNKEWQMQFTDWNAVVPMTRQEAWKRKNNNVAPWADHLNFMDSRLESMVKLAALACRENDPNAKISISGTQPPTAYGGMDWWRQMKWFDGVMNYNNGGQRDLQRSFKPHGDLLHWGLGYSLKGGVLTYSLWKTLFIGEKGVMGFHSPSIINPDMTFSTGAENALKPLSILTGGIGKHFINNLKSSHVVAILYSQASIRAAFIKKQRKTQTQLREKYISLCRNTGVDFDFLSYEQLAEGELAKRGYKALILPNSAALSTKEIRGIRDFSNNGGVVVAEGEPAVMDEHCRPFAKSALSDLFNGKNAFLDKFIDVTYNGALLYPNSEKNAKIIKSQQHRFLSRLRKAKIVTCAEIIEQNGRRVRDAEFFLKVDSKGNKYVGVITPNKKTRQVTFKFPHKAYLYELRTGRSFGYTDNVKLFFANSKPYLFALLNKPPGELNVEINKNGNILSINVETKNAIDNVVNMRVFSPYGKRISFYRKNIILKNGNGRSRIRFALNDPTGKWILKFKDVVSNQTITKNVSVSTK